VKSYPVIPSDQCSAKISVGQENTKVADARARLECSTKLCECNILLTLHLPHGGGPQLVLLHACQRGLCGRRRAKKASVAPDRSAPGCSASGAALSSSQHPELRVCLSSLACGILMFQLCKHFDTASK